MKRRELLQVMGAAAMAPLAASGLAADPGSSHVAQNTASTKKHKFPAAKISLGNSFFLSKTNPIATTDQIEMEALAMKVAGTPVVIEAKARAARRFKILAGTNLPEEAWLNFDAKMDEWAFHYALMAVNGDSNYPKVLGNMYGAAHEWFGMKVPGNRGPGSGDNVENNYSIIPIDWNARYELYGKRGNPPIGDCPIYVVADLAVAVNTAFLDWRDVQVNADDSFAITIDREPANGRPNHIRIDIDARYLFLRDCQVDWRQVPNAYRIKRLDPPTAPPFTTDHVAERAARFVVSDVAMNYCFRANVGSVGINVVSPPEGAIAFGGQPSQKLSRGCLKLADDEAFVLTLGTGGAKYWNVIHYDPWLIAGNYWSRSSSLNSTQSAANGDGSYTYVFSIQDPGVNNWIDTLGLHDSLFFIRWQLLPRNGAPWTKGEVVKLKEVEGILPVGTKRVSPDERKQQLAERMDSFNLRFAV